MAVVRGVLAGVCRGLVRSGGAGEGGRCWNVGVGGGVGLIAVVVVVVIVVGRDQSLQGRLRRVRFGEGLIGWVRTVRNRSGNRILGRGFCGFRLRVGCWERAAGKRCVLERWWEVGWDSLSF